MNVVSRHVKKVALSSFALAGVDRLAISFHARDALVLAYHGILSSEKGEPFMYHHTVEEFESHLDWLGARCTPANLADFLRWKHGEWQPRKPPVLITFDDGYRNNATLAAPLLTRKGFPALFFVTTGYVEGDSVLWPEEVFERVLAWNGRSVEDPAGRFRVVPEEPATREELALEIVEACKDCSDTRRREFLAYLAGETPLCNPLQDPVAQEIMSWDDVRALAAAGFDLGSHTVTHAILSNVSPDQLVRELCDSRSAIELQTNRQCTALAYPGGRLRDLVPMVLDATAGAGYDCAFVVSDRWCSRSSGALQLDRISPPGHSNLATFAFHASGSRRWFRR
jgi:peptidoglycan/xylan/chitin deacetylase (PgdA/CDA1 family)